MSTTVDPQELIDSTVAPVETLDVRSLGPPNPLRETLEKLADSDEIVLPQRSDRARRYRHPKLDDRGDAYDTSERNDGVVTVIREA